jgi:hypothetical protein
VEDEVCKGLKDKWRNTAINICPTCEVLENKFNDRCDQIQHSCITVMDTFIILEKGIKENTNQIVQLDKNQAWLEGWSDGMTSLLKDVQELSDLVLDQAATTLFSRIVLGSWS